MKQKEENIAVVQEDINPKDGEVSVTGAMAEGVGDGGADAEPASVSARDAYRGRIKEDYPDLDMEDEEAYYTAASERYDDYKNMRDGLRNLNGMIDKNPLFRDMMVAASEGGEDWNPIKWMVEERGLDLSALAEDENYAETFADAQRKHLKQLADGEAMKKEAGENYAKSVEAIDAYCAENGITDEQKNDAWVKVEQMLTDANVGKVPVEVFALLVNGGKYDADVAKAEEKGYQDGLGKNVTDKLRRIPKPERNGGRQAAEAQPRPSRETKNMFMA